jgi:hypothetical protein
MTSSRAEAEKLARESGEADLEVGGHALLVVSINRTFPRLSAYDAARYAWRVSPARARNVQYVIATKARRVVGVIRTRDAGAFRIQRTNSWRRDVAPIPRANATLRLSILGQRISLRRHPR